MRRILLAFTLLTCSLFMARSQNYIYICGPAQYEPLYECYWEPKPPCEVYKDYYENCKMFETAPGSGIYTGDFYFGSHSWHGFRFHTKLYDGDALESEWESTKYNVIYPASSEFTFLEPDECGISKLNGRFVEAPSSENESFYPSNWGLPGFKDGWYHIEVDTNNYTVLADNGDALFVVGSTTSGKFPTYDTVDDFKDVAITSASPDRKIEIGDNKFSVFYYSLARNEVIMASEENEVAWEENVFDINRCVRSVYTPGMDIKPWKSTGWTKRNVLFTKDGFIDYDNISQVYFAPEGYTWTTANGSEGNYLTLNETARGSHIYTGVFPASHFNNPENHYISLTRSNKFGNMARINGDRRVIFDPRGYAADAVTFACEGNNFTVPALKGDNVKITLDLNDRTCEFEADASNASDYKIFMCDFTPDCERTYANVSQFKDWMMWPATEGSKVYHGNFDLQHRPFECYISDRLSDTPGKVYLPDGVTEVTPEQNKLDCKVTTKLTDSRWSVGKWKEPEFRVSLNEEDLSVTYPSVFDGIFITGNLTGWSSPYYGSFSTLSKFVLRPIAPKVYEGVFDTSKRYDQYLVFRFYTDLEGWDENSIGCQVDDQFFDYELTDGLFTGECCDGKGSWNFKGWAGTQIRVRVNLNNYTVQFCDPDIATLPEFATEMYLVGDVTDWKAPETANSEHYQAFKLAQTESGIFTGTFDIPADKANFLFYTKLAGWETGAIGVAKDDDEYENYFPGAEYTATYVDGGRGSWKFPYWEGGNMEMTVDTNKGTVRFTKGTTEVSIEAPVNSALGITASEGCLIIRSDRDICVDIYTSLGIKVKSVNVTPGTTTVRLPHGFYIVNGTKIAL